MAFWRGCTWGLLVLLLGWPGISAGDSLRPNIVRVYVLLEMNGETVLPEMGPAYDVVAIRENGTHFEPPVVDSLIHVSSGGDAYAILDIPLGDDGGLSSGDTVIFHVYWSGSKLLVGEPSGGRWTIPAEAGGDTRSLNILTISGPGAPVCLTQADLDRQVAEALRPWDVGADGRVGLEEAIRALQIVAGMR